MERQRTPVVSVAILTWNRRDSVIRAIDSVYRQSYRPFEIVLVDSASTDGTIEAVAEAYPEVKLIRLHRNMGCPEGRNVAWANCTGDIIFSLDDDAYLSYHTLERCVERFQQDTGIACITCSVESTSQARGIDHEEGYVTSFLGGACAIRRDVVQKVGYFPSDFFRQAEDSDLSLRIIDEGFRILHSPVAVVYHDDSLASSNRGLFMFFSCRNELYTVVRRYPLFVIPTGVLWKGLIWSWRGIQNGAVHFTMGGWMVAMLRLPWLLQQRDPVSLGTIVQLFKARGRRP